MDVRRKLVELLDRFQYCGRTSAMNGMKAIPNEEIADRLIAHGVTVQEWISVKDRLPEQTDPATAVLGITKHGKCHIVYYYKAVTNEEFTGFYDSSIKRDITHWMPLPQPPKEAEKALREKENG